MNICALASGSNGNCYYIEDSHDAVIVDAGVSARQIMLRMANLGLDIGKVRGVFITHEHIDHIRGAEVLCKNNKIPLYITSGTLQNSCLASSGLIYEDELIRNFEIGQKIKFQDLEVEGFSKNHDAAEPCSIVLRSHSKKVGVMTDIGKKCHNVIKHLSDCDALFLESNYDEFMLQNGWYPAYLKNRIKGDLGHMSNYQAALLVLEHATPRLKHVVLSHLSENNNTPELALKTFTTLLKERSDLHIHTLLASRHCETEMIRL